jgi:hypothetical protein
MNNSLLINNTTNKNIVVMELDIILCPGISDLYELGGDKLIPDNVMHSLSHGTLSAAISNGDCYIILLPQQSLTRDVILKPLKTLQIHPSRTKFVVSESVPSPIFDEEDVGLFEDEKLKPARELAEEIKNDYESTEKIEATIKQANLPEKVIETRYTPKINEQTKITQDKVKNNVAMKYNTCLGKTAAGKNCMRQAGKNGYCGLHSKQKK